MDGAIKILLWSSILVIVCSSIKIPEQLKFTVVKDVKKLGANLTRLTPVSTLSEYSESFGFRNEFIYRHGKRITGNSHKLKNINGPCFTERF